MTELHVVIFRTTELAKKAAQRFDGCVVQDPFEETQPQRSLNSEDDATLQPTLVAEGAE